MFPIFVVVDASTQLSLAQQVMLRSDSIDFIDYIKSQNADIVSFAGNIT